jgi:hypothetical protein
VMSGHDYSSAPNGGVYSNLLTGHPPARKGQIGLCHI